MLNCYIEVFILFPLDFIMVILISIDINHSFNLTGVWSCSQDCQKTVLSVSSCNTLRNYLYAKTLHQRFTVRQFWLPNEIVGILSYKIIQRTE